MAKIDKKNKPGMIPWIIVAFFATFILVDITFYILASKSSRGVVTKDSYQKGRDYNEVLQKVELQKKLGWRIESELIENIQKSAHLQTCLFDKNNQKIKNAKMFVKLKRPVQEGQDFEQKMVAKNGCFEAKIDFPVIGQWIFEFVAVKNQDALQKTKRYVIQ